MKKSNAARTKSHRKGLRPGRQPVRLSRLYLPVASSVLNYLNTGRQKPRRRHYGIALQSRQEVSCIVIGECTRACNAPVCSREAQACFPQRAPRIPHRRPGTLPEQSERRREKGPRWKTKRSACFSKNIDFFDWQIVANGAGGIYYQLRWRVFSLGCLISFLVSQPFPVELSRD
jgi:hypothetical protein